METSLIYLVNTEKKYLWSPIIIFTLVLLPSPAWVPPQCQGLGGPTWATWWPCLEGRGSLVPPPSPELRGDCGPSAIVGTQERASTTGYVVGHQGSLGPDPRREGKGFLSEQQVFLSQGWRSHTPSVHTDSRQQLILGFYKTQMLLQTLLFLRKDLAWHWEEVRGRMSLLWFDRKERTSRTQGLSPCMAGPHPGGFHPQNWSRF